jgi:hypothetical protein
MVDIGTVLVVAALFVVQSLVILGFRKRRKAAPPVPEAAQRGRVHLPANTPVQGHVVIEGDVVLTAAPGMAAGEFVELDVPTPHVDRILRAFRGVGFAADDTGMTVDTDEGEEQLTTLRLGLESLRVPRRRGSAIALMRATGSLTLQPGCTVEFDLEAADDVLVGDGCRIRGDVQGGARVALGTNVAVEGRVKAKGDVLMGPGSRAESVETRAEVVLDSVDQEKGLRIRASGVRVGARSPREPQTLK